MATERKKRVVSCPHCGQEVEWSDKNPFRPFCSERCKLIDLGQWANERYRVPEDEPPPGTGTEGSGHA